MFWNSLKTPGRWAPNGFSVFLAVKATFTQENFAFFLENFRNWAEKFGCVGHESGLASEWSSTSLVIEWCPTSSWIDFLRVPNFEKKRFTKPQKWAQPADKVKSSIERPRAWSTKSDFCIKVFFGGGNFMHWEFQDFPLWKVKKFCDPKAKFLK